MNKRYLQKVDRKKNLVQGLHSRDPERGALRPLPISTTTWLHISTRELLCVGVKIDGKAMSRVMRKDKRENKNI